LLIISSANQRNQRKKEFSLTFFPVNLYMARKKRKSERIQRSGKRKAQYKSL
jgi:uncharacterized membrane protein